jgi:hypothetical protein
MRQVVGVPTTPNPSPNQPAGRFQFAAPLADALSFAEGKTSIYAATVGSL